MTEYLHCPHLSTTYRAHYRGLPSIFPIESLKPEQADEQVISMHNWSNLQVNGHKLKSKVFPKSSFGVEEYRSFLKKMARCKEEIYKLHFERPGVDFELIERMLKELELTSYRHWYSPNAYRPRNERQVLDKLPKVNLKYYATTYGTYFNRIKELEEFMIQSFAWLPEIDRAALVHEMNRYYLCGYTTYYGEYCIPGIENMKKYNLLDAPLDRHTLRRW